MINRALATGRGPMMSEGLFTTRLRITMVEDPPPSRFSASWHPNSSKIFCQFIRLIPGYSLAAGHPQPPGSRSVCPRVKPMAVRGWRSVSNPFRCPSVSISTETLAGTHDPRSSAYDISEFCKICLLQLAECRNGREFILCKTYGRPPSTPFQQFPVSDYGPYRKIAGKKIGIDTSHHPMIRPVIAVTELLTVSCSDAKIPR